MAKCDSFLRHSVDPSNGFNTMHECNRHTDHATEKCVGIIGIACSCSECDSV